MSATTSADTMEYASLLKLFEKRHSGYEFSDKSLPEGTVDKIAKVASLCESAYNEQPWRVVLAEKAKSFDVHAKILATLTEKNQAWAGTPAMLVVVVGCKNFTKDLPGFPLTGKPDRHWMMDSGRAAHAIHLAATSLGLMAHEMAGFDHEALEKALGIEAGLEALSVIAIGYEKENAAPRPKVRHPVDERFFKGAWKN